MTSSTPSKSTFGAPETMYCAEQIRIPSELPEILKNYTKFVIKNQPLDIISASAEYFGRLAKQRSKTSAGGKKMTNQQLEAVYRKPSFTRKEIEAISADAPQGQVYDVLALGGWSDTDIPWTLHATIETICEILGDNGQVSASPLLDMFTYLAERDHSIPSSVSGKFVKSMQERGEVLDINFLVETLKADIPQKFDITSNAPIQVAAPDRPISTFSAAYSSASISTPGTADKLKSRSSKVGVAEQTVEAHEQTGNNVLESFPNADPASLETANEELEGKDTAHKGLESKETANEELESRDTANKELESKEPANEVPASLDLAKEKPTSAVKVISQSEIAMEDGAPVQEYSALAVKEEDHLPETSVSPEKEVLNPVPLDPTKPEASSVVEPAIEPIHPGKEFREFQE